MDRVIKRFTIALIFLVIAAGVGYGIYAFVNVDPTCYDRVQNQGEEGVDCGTTCGNTCDPIVVPLEIVSQRLIAAGESEYDFIARIRNSNTSHGAANVSYDIILKDKNGAAVNTIQGTFYILPVQTKYIVKTPIRIIGTGITPELIIKDVVWHKVNVVDLKIDFPLVGEQHGAVSVPGVRYQEEGTLSNKSDFDFDQVDVLVVVQDFTGEIHAVTSTTINTFLSQSLRYFKVTWPDEISGEGVMLQVQASTNVFNNSNFIRRYGTEEKFQRY